MVTEMVFSIFVVRILNENKAHSFGMFISQQIVWFKKIQKPVFDSRPFPAQEWISLILILLRYCHSLSFDCNNSNSNALFAVFYSSITIETLKNLNCAHCTGHTHTNSVWIMNSHYYGCNVFIWSFYCSHRCCVNLFFCISIELCIVTLACMHFGSAALPFIQTKAMRLKRKMKMFNLCMRWTINLPILPPTATCAGHKVS